MMENGMALVARAGAQALRNCKRENEALRANLDKMARHLEPFCRLGGGPELQAFADLEDDVIVWKNSGEAVTAGDVRRAREVLAKHRGVPVSMMHFRKPYVEPEYATIQADLKAVAVAAQAFYGSYAIEPKMQIKADALGKALNRDGVKKFLDENH